MPPVEFSGFIVSLAQAALMQLGDIPDPTTGKRHAFVDFVLAPAGVSPGRLRQVRMTEAIVELARAGQGIAVLADALGMTPTMIRIAATGSIISSGSLPSGASSITKWFP